ncbi:hypothetical protein BDP81DRAFT_454291 [Colletotrichum phormii]|uniref:Uncharacterized protein n=1 Tax=Colletotrichum phormii TaxID=359342 RepID=A0AAI9ZG05_9PEZI|nr:uncharacterized protein BDP81DRAFT_454291 [Colletotrichum phormii]KAK1623855.1 hypothetical protein BDP81DRAFT_454291 [Colletotrichum phormii]
MSLGWKTTFRRGDDFHGEMDGPTIIEDCGFWVGQRRARTKRGETRGGVVGGGGSWVENSGGRRDEDERRMVDDGGGVRGENSHLLVLHGPDSACSHMDGDTGGCWGLGAGAGASKGLASSDMQYAECGLGSHDYCAFIALACHDATCYGCLASRFAILNGRLGPQPRHGCQRCDADAGKGAGISQIQKAPRQRQIEKDVRISPLEGELERDAKMGWLLVVWVVFAVSVPDEGSLKQPPPSVRGRSCRLRRLARLAWRINGLFIVLFAFSLSGTTSQPRASLARLADGARDGALDSSARAAVGAVAGWFRPTLRLFFTLALLAELSSALDGLA